jgi:hypothetical protein
MPGTLPAVDRPTPSVAIVGTDAVLAAAPATPVQLAHACLRRGFSVAVPASWGDELVAAETVRQLATRPRGPAVMCVCPFARARLLGSGPDLAPFLVSLVTPPVAVARYLRAAYGGHGVHITYIGACPGADDPSIDERLTPDAFIADLAEHGIALSEQPLVFDSIVPPDRRRWCSLPGGVPNADALSVEPDGRVLVEMGSEDVTTDLAQHILAREHLLFDLAPGLGCACSGAIGIVPADRARAAVAAVEPPRALSAVIDPATAVPLEQPVAMRSGLTPMLLPPAQPSTPHGEDKLERVLDEFLGAASSVSEPDTGATAVIVDLPSLPPLPEAAATVDVIADEAASPGERSAIEAAVATDPADPAERAVFEDHRIESVAVPPTVADTPSATDDDNIDDLRNEATLGSGATDTEVAAGSTDGAAPAPFDVPTVDASVAIETAPVPVEEPLVQFTTEELAEQPVPPVRRRTPSATPRFSGSGIPRATVADGRPLPRAYVAKRRTPPSGAVVIVPPAIEPAPTEVVPPTHRAAEAATSSESVAPTVSLTSAPAAGAALVAPDETPETSDTPVLAMSSAPAVGDEAATAAPAVAASAASSTETPVRAAPGNAARQVAARSATHPALLFLLVTALVALAVFVLLTLDR